MQVTFLWEPSNEYATGTESCVYTGTFDLSYPDADSLGTFKISDPSWTEDLWASGMGMPQTFTGVFNRSDRTLELSYTGPGNEKLHGPHKFQA